MHFVSQLRRSNVLILSATVFVVSSLSLASSPAKQPDKKKAGLFAYDASVPFDLKEESAKEEDGVTIRDINYAGYAPKHGRIKAYLVQPSATVHLQASCFFIGLAMLSQTAQSFLTKP
jgi:hypothetical protein